MRFAFRYVNLFTRKESTVYYEGKFHKGNNMYHEADIVILLCSVYTVSAFYDDVAFSGKPT